MPKSTAAAKVERPVEEEAQADEMAPNLHERCEKVRLALAKSGPQDARARHQLGELVKDAKADAQKYGKKAVHQIAVSLGYDEKTLYRYGQVAEAWSFTELEELLKRSSPKTGMPISFSHLLEIAAIKTKGDRKKLVNAVLKEGLSVRALKIRITPDRAASGDQQGVGTAQVLLRGLRSMSEIWLPRTENWEAILLALDETPPSPELREDYQKTVEQQRELIARLQRVNEKLSSWLGESPASGERPMAIEKDGDEGAGEVHVEVEEAAAQGSRQAEVEEADAEEVELDEAEVEDADGEET